MATGSISLLIELYEDVARWRETGGDPRDLRYILETLDKIEPHDIAQLRQSLPNIDRMTVALHDILDGAEQHSQSHIDVAVKCRAALGN